MKINDLNEKIIGIYQIIFPNGKSYIGLSNDIKRRIKEHYKDNRQPVLYTALKKYYQTIEEVEFLILEKIPEENYQLLSEREKYWINEYSSNQKDYGYNLTTGGIDLVSESNPFAKFSQIEVTKIREMLKEGVTNIEIAQKFKCHTDTISKINIGKTYYDANIDYPIRKTIKRKTSFDNPNSISKEKYDQIIYLLKESNKSIAEISKEMEISVSECHRINQGKAHFNSEYIYPIRKSKKHRITSNEIKEVISLLKEGEFSITYIAQLFSCSRDTISDINLGKRHKIEGESYPIRTKYPSRRISKITGEPVSTSLGAKAQGDY